MKRLLFTILLLGGISLGMAQSVSGTVSDQQGIPLAGVSVLIKGTTEGTSTNFDGEYSIDASGDDVLIFSYVGMQTLEVPVNDRSQINVTLREDAQALDEVVVTALGIEREKKALGYASQELQTEQILQVPETNVVSALQGKVAGAQVTRNGGAPGQGSRIVIRGVNSLSPNAPNQPLFVIDGIPISNDTFTAGGGGFRGLTNRAADINLNDVENISVLKGGAATALYGVRGANGVIVITTRSGREGRTEFNLSATSGIDYVNKFPVVQREYTQGYAGAYDTNSFWPTWGPTVAEARELDPEHPDEIFNNFRNAYQTGYNTNLHFDASGGNEKASFYASVGHFNQEGVLPFADFTRNSAKINGKIKVADNFTINGSANYINSGGNRVDVDLFNTRLIYWAPAKDVTDFEFTEGPLAGTMKGYRFDGQVGNNPIYGAKTNRFVDDVDRFIGNIGFDFQPFEKVNITYRFGIDSYNDSRSAFAPGPTGIEGEAIFENNGLGYVRETRINSEDLTSTLIATYQTDLGEDFDLTIRGGLDVFQREYNRVTTNGNELDVYNFFALQNASVITADQFRSLRRLYGIYGELSMSYRDLLYLTITDRNDWSSTLGEDNRSFNYPSVSVGYIFTEQFNTPSWFQYGKLRGSWSQVGKDAFQAYLTADGYAPASGFPIDETTGWTRFNQKGDPNLVNELTTEIEFGGEFRMFDNRLGLDIAYYKSNSENQILTVPVALSSGYSVFATNAGEIQNQGIEMIFNAAPIRTMDFGWDVLVNFSTNDNEVISIREGSESIPLGSDFGYAGSTATQALYPGQSYGAILGTSYARYYENPEDEDPLVLDEDRPILIGEDGFPVINRDQKILGTSTPDWIMNIQNTFRYKNFSLSFAFDFREGFQKFNNLDNFMSAFGISDYTTNRNDVVVFEGVTADGQPNTQEVFLGQANAPDGFTALNGGFYRANYRAVTENFVQDASWVRLQNLSLSYNVPTSLIDNIGLTRASLSLSGTNLFLWTDYNGWDPEVSINPGNVDGFNGLAAHPGLKTYAATLKLSF
ncbi:SusC/RagA family TonB-linked outer membrane protein [Robertkochia aurantiaca]|uniref:SusC/RagA family TonB-linked outer membrane protein n=1 Tax=Robertkochia aurantiaca TaxID=2873700 RepID=UPI001CCC223C|nr:SusC/RagA family TonB-linked outer membrane protein [Robertkochia sp. 3YJGBD-33]